MKNRKIKILHCPTAVGSFGPLIAKHEKKNGIESHSLLMGTNIYFKHADFIVHPSFINRFIWLLKLIFSDYSIIWFNFGTSLIPTAYIKSHHNVGQKLLREVYNLTLGSLFDVYLLKRCGKKIIVSFQGDDIRQEDFARKHFKISHTFSEGYGSPELDRLKRTRVQKWTKYADKIFAFNPDLLHLLPPYATFFPYCRELPDIEYHKRHSKRLTDSLRVVHAPTDRAVKGTQFVLDTVERLKHEGHLIELILVEGKSNKEALDIYATADLAIDQLRTGWYGGFAVELMALGKPVLSYIREGDLKFIPQEMRDELPIIDANQDTLYEALLKLLHNRHKIHEIGLQSRKFVEKWHDVEKRIPYLQQLYQDLLNPELSSQVAEETIRSEELG